jgi:hemoglobin
MIVEYLRYTVPALALDAFCRAWQQSLAIVEKDANCLGVEMCQAVEKTNVFTIRILWTSVEGHERGFKGSHSYSQALELVKPFHAYVDPEIHHHRIVYPSPGSPINGPMPN